MGIRHPRRVHTAMSAMSMLEIVKLWRQNMTAYFFVTAYPNSREERESSRETLFVQFHFKDAIFDFNKAVSIFVGKINFKSAFNGLGGFIEFGNGYKPVFIIIDL